MTKSITDLTEREQQLHMDAYERFMNTWEKKITEADRITPRSTNDASVITSWDEFESKYAEGVKESFLAGRGPGGSWEPETYTVKGGAEKEAWRFVEGLYTEDQIRDAYIPKEYEPEFNPTYERKYEGGIKSSFKKRVVDELRDVDANKGLKTDKIKKSDYKKPKLPKSVRKYAEGSTPINNTAKLAIKGLKADLKM